MRSLIRLSVLVAVFVCTISVLSANQLYNSEIEQYRRMKINELREFVKSDPSSPVPYVELGDRYLRSKDYTNAEKMYLKAKVIDPEFRFAYEGLGQIYIEWKRFDEAIICFEKAIERKSFHFQAYGYLAEIYAVHLNKRKRAIEVLQTFEDNLMKFGKKEQGIRADYYIQLAAIYYKIDMLSESRAYLESAAQLSTNRESINRVYVNSILSMYDEDMKEKLLIEFSREKQFEQYANFMLQGFYRKHSKDSSDYKKHVTNFVNSLYEKISKSQNVSGNESLTFCQAIMYFDQKGDSIMLRWLTEQTLKLCELILNNNPDDYIMHNEKFESIFRHKEQVSENVYSKPKSKTRKVFKSGKPYISFENPEITILNTYIQLAENGKSSDKEKYRNLLFGFKPKCFRSYQILADFHLRNNSPEIADTLYSIILEKSRLKKSDSEKLSMKFSMYNYYNLSKKYLDIAAKSIDQDTIN